MPAERTLLVIEDHAAVATAVRSYMSRLGTWAVVITAADAAHGLALAAAHEPDAIVLDNRMPGGDGISVLADLRRACPRAVIVMHTSEDTAELRERADRLGADAVLGKGRPLGELARALASPNPGRVA